MFQWLGHKINALVDSFKESLFVNKERSCECNNHRMIHTGFPFDETGQDNLINRSEMHSYATVSLLRESDNGRESPSTTHLDSSGAVTDGNFLKHRRLSWRKGTIKHKQKKRKTEDYAYPNSFISLELNSEDPFVQVKHFSLNSRKGRPSMQLEYFLSNSMRMHFEEEANERRTSLEANLRHVVHRSLYQNYENIDTIDMNDVVIPVKWNASIQPQIPTSLDEFAIISNGESDVDFLAKERPAIDHSETMRKANEIELNSTDDCPKDSCDLVGISEEESLLEEAGCVFENHGEIATQTRESTSTSEDGYDMNNELVHVGPRGCTLSNEQLHIIEKIWDPLEDGREIISVNEKIRISRAQLMCLRDGEWLSDEIINLKLDMINKQAMQEYSKSNFKSLNLFVWNTFFYAKLMGHAENSKGSNYEYDRVRRWTTRKAIDVFSLDRVVVPIHSGMHWSCAVIDLKEKKFEYYDSLCHVNKECLEGLAQWIKDESIDKRGLEINLSDWSYIYNENIPRQTNNHDCGVFTILFVETVGCGRPLNFTHEHIRYFRRRFVIDILENVNNEM